MPKNGYFKAEGLNIGWVGKIRNNRNFGIIGQGNFYKISCFKIFTMNITETLRDIVENRKSGLFKAGQYILLFKEGKLLEVAGKTSNREEALKDILENDYKDYEFQEVNSSTLISFQEPLDISDKLTRKKRGREIKIDENIHKKIQDIKLIVPSLNKILVGKIKGEIIAYIGFEEGEIDNVANNVDLIYEKFINLKDIILNSENSSTLIKFIDDKYILCSLNSSESIGILRVIISELIK
jgi:hypothetical protein